MIPVTASLSASAVPTARPRLPTPGACAIVFAAMAAWPGAGGLASDAITALSATPEPPPADVAARAPEASMTGPPFEALGPMELELEFARAMQQEDFAAAVELGERWLAMLEQTLGDEDVGLVDPLTRLGHAQREHEQFDKAEDSLLQAIHIARKRDGRYSELQLAPMAELGKTYHDMQEHVLAVTTFNEARGLSRRLHGLLNLDQIEMLDGMAWSLLAMEAYDEAQNRQLEAFRISERHFGPDSLELLPALYRLALWYRQTGQFNDERMLYMRAIRMLEEDGGDHDPRIIEPLRRLAHSMQLMASFVDPRSMASAPTGYPSAEQALNRALAIARAQDAPAPQVEALLLIDQGDWHMALTRRTTALQRYTAAWQLLEGSVDGELLRRRWFGRPVAVTVPQPSWLGIRPRGSEPGLENGIVVATFTVSAQGQVQNIEIIESYPPRRKDATVRRTLRSMRFRPRFEDGEPVTTEQQRYVFKFGFKP